MKVIRLAEQAVDILVRYLGEERVSVPPRGVRVPKRFIQNGGDLKAAAFCSQFYKAQRRALVEYYHKQAAPDHTNKDAFMLAFVKDGWENILADELCHRA